MNDLRAQLAPGWSGVNIALAIVLGLFALPLGLLMIAYIVWGKQLGLDFSQPGSVKQFGQRLAHSWRAAKDAWRQEPGVSRVGTSAAGTPDWSGTGGEVSEDTLRREREMLAREREDFESEKRSWQTGERSAKSETLDS